MEAAMIANVKRVRGLLALVTLVIWSAVADARPLSSSTHEARIGACIRQASGGRAWLEKTLWGLRDQEGGWIGAEVPNSNGSHDLGPLQVNTFWVPKLSTLTGRPPDQVRGWLASDPCFNVQAARWIFLSALSATGAYWKAVGVYHSPTGWRQRRYALSVSRHLERRFGARVFAASPSVAQQ
ncbi:murein transglycosylase [Sphingobium sp. GW456-12-10-14-TSB1]|nr:murein transglycosylase [Sphingobium sp. GW456-12-10-14-TSB1]